MSMLGADDVCVVLSTEHASNQDLNGSAGRMFGGFASEKQMEVLTRIADSIDNLATITSAGFERLAQSQDSLNKTLADLLNK
uniref:Uncharacterized protein n=1 Tax=Timema genevievae TaxID=629358 RepID=A0A7R9JS81_TIMGE|nr:unnamed protein product [Timema genevievae]